MFDPETFFMTLIPIEGDHTIEIRLTSQSGLTSKFELFVNFHYPELEAELSP